ncbi:MAG: hypothetical protein HY050_09020 [Actinobacteria bacterium]|nr:hypothetical protein [Actinomycetota bacterium]
MIRKKFKDEKDEFLAAISSARAELRTPMLESISMSRLAPLLVVVILLAALPATRLLLKPKATYDFVPVPVRAAEIMFLLFLIFAFMLTRAIVGKVANGNAKLARNVSAVAKAVTVTTLALAGSIAAIGGVMFPGGFAATKLNAFESEFSIALALAAFLAAVAAIIIAQRVLKRNTTEEIAEAVFSTVTAIATVAVAGIVIVLVFLILFFRILEGLIVIGILVTFGAFIVVLLSAIFSDVADKLKTILKISK